MDRYSLQMASLDPRVSNSTRPTGPLPFACRKPLLRFQPLHESALSIEDAAADFCKNRAVAPHPSFGQPRNADAQKVRHFPRGQQPLAIERPDFFDFSIYITLWSKRPQRLRASRGETD